mgnify:CR=1 FL=1|tara:strand:- start:134 stop:502 length:369 start_codon:yes stop_codon:yes gene_type:complete
MKDITKKEILDIVKESNKKELEEYSQTYADELGSARAEILKRYSNFVESAQKFLQQMVEKARMDYQEGVIQDADIDHLINNQLQDNMRYAVDYAISSLDAITKGGIKDQEKGPWYPTDGYGE